MTRTSVLVLVSLTIAAAQVLGARTACRGVKSSGSLTSSGSIKPSGSFKAFVPFGDSYTDINAHADGGIVWPVYVAGEAGVELHSFAVGGAVCNTTLTPAGTNDVLGAQLPAYADANLDLDPATTVYSLWIGTNDVGHTRLIDGAHAAGVSIVDVAHCGVDWVQKLYDSGARNFISMNMIPLDLTPSYTKPNQNMELLRELVASGNKLRDMMLQILAPSLPGAHIGLFDAHGLFMDMINHSGNYLNGTVAVNTTSTVLDCKNDGGCSNDTDRDSFLWYDDLHPSEQADRIVAREMAAVIRGAKSRWMTWLS